MANSKDIETAAQAHTNLNLFAAVAGILESGTVYPIGIASNTAQKIVKPCQQEQQRQLQIYDSAVSRAGGAE